MARIEKSSPIVYCDAHNSIFSVAARSKFKCLQIEFPEIHVEVIDEEPPPLKNPHYPNESARLGLLSYRNIIYHQLFQNNQSLDKCLTSYAKSP